jgi:hypothetical protein
MTRLDFAHLRSPAITMTIATVTANALEFCVTRFGAGKCTPLAIGVRAIWHEVTSSLSSFLGTVICGRHDTSRPSRSLVTQHTKRGKRRTANVFVRGAKILIFVHTPIEMTSESVSEGCSVAGAILLAASVFPFDLRKGIKSMSLYIPGLALAVFVVYERAIRTQVPAEDVPIRVDLLVVQPLLAFLLLMGVIRWVWVCLMVINRPPELRKSGRLAQLVAVAVAGTACGLWLGRNWW